MDKDDLCTHTHLQIPKKNPVLTPSPSFPSLTSPSSHHGSRNRVESEDGLRRGTTVTHTGSLFAMYAI